MTELCKQTVLQLSGLIHCIDHFKTRSFCCLHYILSFHPPTPPPPFFIFFIFLLLICLYSKNNQFHGFRLTRWNIPRYICISDTVDFVHFTQQSKTFVSVRFLLCPADLRGGENERGKGWGGRAGGGGGRSERDRDEVM